MLLLLSQPTGLFLLQTVIGFVSVSMRYPNGLRRTARSDVEIASSIFHFFYKVFPWYVVKP